MVNILVTGAAGFIGFHVCKALLSRGEKVVGLDNLNDYYSVELKQDRLNLLTPSPGFRFEKVDFADRAQLRELFSGQRFDRVIHLGAQAGVRYSLEHPEAYVESNLVGFLNILECCRHQQVPHLVYASSSSVYGSNTSIPFSAHDACDHPLSLYAATKKSNELMAHSYSHLYGLPTTGLRFFTVYGPWGRPDMAMFLFTKAILAGQPINVFNHGEMKRDMTYVDDVVEGVLRVCESIPQPDPGWSGTTADAATSSAPYRIYNIGNNHPVRLKDMISTIEASLGRKAVQNLCEMQAGDVVATWADVDDLIADVGYSPSTPIEVGVERFVEWYREYYRV
ncbi:NAD-dependent epimerase [Planctomicrobium sp. SH668]|uniref:NAD-dependent epimerase n=1 Tax=Planctomicrobium sp. SH668 TaxID=3448126 RepID=UPI003F5CA35E